MKRVLWIGLLFALLILVLTGNTVFAANTTYQIRGTYAQAYAYTLDSSGCLFTSVGLIAQDGQSRDDSGKAATATATFYYTYSDICHSVLYFDFNGSVSLSDRDFRVQGNLGSALLVTTIPVVDNVTQHTSSVAINVTWTATGEPERIHANGHTNYGNVKVNYRSDSLVQPANASGSILLDGENLYSGRTPGGDMGRTAHSEITINH